jgi:hypothetical protein
MYFYYRHFIQILGTKCPILFTLKTYSHISDGFIGSKPSQKLKHYCAIILQKLAAAAVDGGECRGSI